MTHLKVRRDGAIYDTKKRRIIPTRSDGRGYMCLTIGNKTYKHHKVVCILKHGPRPSANHLPMHRNNKKTDNRPSNIFWGSRSENVRHAHRSGLMKNNKARKVKLFIQWGLNHHDSMWFEAEIFDSVSKAAKYFNLSPGTIASAASGKSKTAAGYRWKYVDA